MARRAADAGSSFSIRWTGAIRPEFGETYTFHADTTGGVRLRLADKLLLDNGAKLRRGESGEVSASDRPESGKDVRRGDGILPTAGRAEGAGHAAA